jgi:hypothetical protein
VREVFLVAKTVFFLYYKLVLAVFILAYAIVHCWFVQGRGLGVMMRWENL